ncbi:MAG: NAD-dependent epimerase/dehydratase family protein, partial [Rhizobacter sp.]
MEILLTGGSGMLGRNLLDVAQTHGVEIAAPTRREMDLNSADSVRSYLRQHRPGLIIHCAGHVGGIQANIADPVGFLTLNLDMGINLVRAA